MVPECFGRYRIDYIRGGSPASWKTTQCLLAVQNLHAVVVGQLEIDIRREIIEGDA
jgi:hypothetical protein